MEKIIVFLTGSMLLLAALSIFAVFSSVIVRLLGFKYEGTGSFILYFIIASIVSYPLNLIAGALPKALLNLDRISRRTAVCTYVLLDTVTTFCGFCMVDWFMDSVCASAVSLVVLAFASTLFGVRDIKKKPSGA